MDGWPYRMGTSDSDGRYSITTVNDLFCPVPVSFTCPVSARFQYRRFNPREDNAGDFAYPLRLSFESLQSKAGINPEFHQRQSDHLKHGDRVRIYASKISTFP